MMDQLSAREIFGKGGDGETDTSQRWPGDVTSILTELTHHTALLQICLYFASLNSSILTPT